MVKNIIKIVNSNLKGEYLNGERNGKEKNIIMADWNFKVNI